MTILADRLQALAFPKHSELTGKIGMLPASSSCVNLCLVVIEDKRDYNELYRFSYVKDDVDLRFYWELLRLLLVEVVLHMGLWERALSFKL
ncbi:hypothetical protein Tco_1135679 [Tanacetum coccineum]